MLKQIFHSVRTLSLRVMLTLAVTGGLALGYSVLLVYASTGAMPTTVEWLLIGSLAGIVALLSAAMVILRALAPFFALSRLVGYLERLPTLLAHTPELSNHELAQRLQCSEDEAARLRHLVEALAQQPALPPTLRRIA
ncbi:MAG TPA: hypothetical protein VF807_12730 [Ktedonobacterales bacterium]